MNRPDDLASLDLQSLTELLVSRTPTVSELSSGQWLGVVELMTMRLTDECGSLSVDSWRTCASALEYALEAAVTSGAIDRRESVIRRLNLAVVLLQRVPPNPEIEILNPSHLISLLFQELPMSVEEARDMSTDWRALDIVQIRRLRAAKNLVSPALRLAKMMSGGNLDGRLEAWEEVFPSLP
ncbi:hypothetical protein OG241_35805 [Streptomyces sp. NBC_01390]|uniref:hypothetical protein n=1 Tax=Streptomyces sp. NBC_01390 TaxID=2903850 RepID=UPI00324A8A22